jgi:hypothetical protein
MKNKITFTFYLLITLLLTGIQLSAKPVTFTVAKQYRYLAGGDSTKKWVSELSLSLPSTSDSSLSAWLSQGIDERILKGTFDTVSNKGKLYSDLINALSIYHRKVIVRQFDFDGLTRSSLVINGFPDGTKLLNTKVKLADGTFDPDFNVTYKGDVMSFVSVTAELIQLPEGSTLYRVCNDGWDQFTGGYWTRTKPKSIAEVIGGTAVQPEWNSFKNMVVYTVPAGGIWVWKGLAATQKLSNNYTIVNPFLGGGAEQILVPLVYRRLKKADGTFDFRAINPAIQKQIVQLPASELPWKR